MAKSIRRKRAEDAQRWGEAAMRVLANELRVGDAIRIHDWSLRIVAVESGLCTAVRTAEFDFYLHFDARDCVDVARTGHSDAAAA